MNESYDNVKKWYHNSFIAGNLDDSVRPTKSTLQAFDRKTVLYPVLAVDLHILSNRLNSKQSNYCTNIHLLVQFKELKMCFDEYLKFTNSRRFYVTIACKGCMYGNNSF